MKDRNRAYTVSQQITTSLRQLSTAYRISQAQRLPTTNIRSKWMAYWCLRICINRVRSYAVTAVGRVCGSDGGCFFGRSVSVRVNGPSGYTPSTATEDQLLAKRPIVRHW